MCCFPWACSLLMAFSTDFSWCSRRAVGAGGGWHCPALPGGAVRMRKRSPFPALPAPGCGEQGIATGSRVPHCCHQLWAGTLAWHSARPWWLSEPAQWHWAGPASPQGRAGLGPALGNPQGFLSMSHASLAQWWECVVRSFCLVCRGFASWESLSEGYFRFQSSFTFCHQDHQAVAAAAAPQCHTQGGDNPDPGWKVLRSPKSNWISVSSCKDPELKALNLWLPGKLLVKWVPWDHKLQGCGGIVWHFEGSLPYIFEILYLSGNILIKLLPLLVRIQKVK